MEDIIRFGKKPSCQGEPIATFGPLGSLHCAAVESSQCHVNGFYFCPIMLRAGKPRVSMPGCSAAVSQCLTGGFVLSLSGCSHWKEGEGGMRVGFSGGALTANSMNPPGALAVSATLPPFPLSSFPWSAHSSVVRSLFGPVTDKAGPERLGLIPELACHSWPIRSCHTGHLTQ